MPSAEDNGQYNTEMKVTVLGSGTSAGVPVIGCDCPVCTSSNPKNNRLRSSIVLRSDDFTILVDCGSDFRQQALQNDISRIDAVLLTHAHSDHVSGLDDLRIYNWRQKMDIPMFGSPKTLADIRRRFDYAFNPMQGGGGVPRLKLIPVEEPFELFGLEIVPLPVMHGLMPVMGFRFGNFGYVTDASEVPPQTIDRLRGVRWLILNALRHRPHPTHLTVAEAVEITQDLNPERAWFTHITHDLEHEETNAQLPEGVELAHDGLEFHVRA